MNNRAVVFDVGNVLINWDPENLYKKMIPDDDKRNFFLSEVCPYTWNLEQDRGRTWEDAINERLEVYPEYEEWIRAYSERWEEMLDGAIEGTVKILKELKEKQVPLYAITNFSNEKFPLAQQIFPFLAESFIDIVVSGDEKLLKPDPEIYGVLIHRNNLQPEALVFIDDSEKNVEGARSVGMSALHFSSPDKLREELKGMGLPL